MLETIRAYAVERLEESGEEPVARAAHVAHFNDWAHEADDALRGPDQAHWLDRFEAEHDNLRAALAWAIASGPPGEGVRVASWLWRFWEWRGYLTEGRRWLTRAIAADAGGPTRFRASCLDGAGSLAWHQGDLAAADPAFQEGARALVRSGRSAWGSPNAQQPRQRRRLPRRPRPGPSVLRCKPRHRP
jgi:hypothetical protein